MSRLFQELKRRNVFRMAVEGDFAACLRYAEKTTQLDPNTPVGHIYRGWALTRLALSMRGAAKMTRPSNGCTKPSTCATRVSAS